MNSSTQMSLILVWALFRGVLWLSVMHSLVCHRVRTKISNCVQMSGLKHWPESNKKKQTNQNKQMPAAMKVEFFTRTSVYRPYPWTVFRSEFPGFVWPVKSCIECHSPFISFIVSKFPWIYLAMSCLSYLSSHQCNRFSLSSLVANIWVLNYSFVWFVCLYRRFFVLTKRAWWEIPLWYNVCHRVSTYTSTN